jgi:addiction module RelE/StbE family toxin
VKVRYTLPALADLEAILDYISEHSPQGAARVKAKIQATERLLGVHPLAGRRTRISWLRRINVSPYPYLIFYEVTDHEAIIHAVRHSSRDPSLMPYADS